MQPGHNSCYFTSARADSILGISRTPTTMLILVADFIGCKSGYWSKVLQQDTAGRLPLPPSTIPAQILQLSQRYRISDSLELEAKTLKMPCKIIMHASHVFDV